MSLLPQFLCLYFIWKGIQASSGYSGYKLGGGIAAGFSGIHVLVQCPGFFTLIILRSESITKIHVQMFSLGMSNTEKLA